MPCSLSGRLDPRHTHSSSDNRSQQVTGWGAFTCCVPHTNFATVDLDGMTLQFNMKQRAHVADSFWWRTTAHPPVVGPGLPQSRVLAPREKEWHQHITLLTTFSLFNVVSCRLPTNAWNDRHGTFSRKARSENQPLPSKPPSLLAWSILVVSAIRDHFQTAIFCPQGHVR